MDLTIMRNEARAGIVRDEYVRFLKHKYIAEILDPDNDKATESLWAYASFLNKLGITSDTYPLYMAVLGTNNKYAIDALLEGHTPEEYLNCVSPNPYLVKQIFAFFDRFKRNEVYELTFRVYCGFLMKVYESAPEGYSLYAPSIEELNSLGKVLDESKDQEYELNRDILDVLMYISDLDMPHENDQHKLALARQSSRIRSDFFDNKRRLSQSLTDTLLENADTVRYGQTPEHIYVG